MKFTTSIARFDANLKVFTCAKFAKNEFFDEILVDRNSDYSYSEK